MGLSIHPLCSSTSSPITPAQVPEEPRKKASPTVVELALKRFDLLMKGDDLLRDPFGSGDDTIAIQVRFAKLFHFFNGPILNELDHLNVAVAVGV